jgi:hypothetical protein
VEPCRSDCAPPVGDFDDVLIERLSAIAAVLDPMPAAVLEGARRLIVVAPREPDTDVEDAARTDLLGRAPCRTGDPQWGDARTVTLDQTWR